MKMIMVNGPCGVGKSTVSRQLAQAINGELISTDELRNTVPETGLFPDVCGQDEATARMWTVNEVGRQMARRALTEETSVVVDSVKYQTAWVSPWEKLGKELGAAVFDVCLTADRSVVLDRAAERGYRPGGRLTPDKVSVLFDKVQTFYANRPAATVIDTSSMTVYGAVNTILDIVDPDW